MEYNLGDCGLNVKINYLVEINLRFTSLLTQHLSAHELKRNKDWLNNKFLMELTLSLIYLSLFNGSQNILMASGALRNKNNKWRCKKRQGDIKQ